jgi:hypothetical protein
LRDTGFGFDGRRPRSKRSLGRSPWRASESSGFVARVAGRLIESAGILTRFEECVFDLSGSRILFYSGVVVVAARTIESSRSVFRFGQRRVFRPG